MRIRLLLLAAALAIPAAAPAQDMGWSTIIPSVAGTDVLGTHLREIEREREASAPRATAPSRPVASAPAAAPASAASLRFTASPARRKANFDKFLAARRGSSDPASEKQLAGFLADPQFMPHVDRELGRFGLRSDNVADVYAVWWIQAWLVAQGTNRDPTQAEVDAVKAQTARVVMSTPQIAGATDAAKQEIADGLIVQTVVLGTVIDQVQGNAEQTRQVGTIARTIARANSVDLDAFTLTDQGFVPK